MRTRYRQTGAFGRTSRRAPRGFGLARAMACSNVSVYVDLGGLCANNEDKLRMGGAGTDPVRVRQVR